MNSQPTTFYIVRHGQTDWNKKQLMLSYSDVALNETGKLQAKDLGEKLKHISFHAAISSDLVRAKRTAEIILLERKLEVKAYEALRERSWGKLEGKDRKEYLKLLEEWAHLSDEEKLKHTAGETMESLDQAISRFLTLLRELAIGLSGKTILVVSHGSVMRGLLIHLGFGTFASLPSGCILNAAYIKLESDGIDFFIKETSGIAKNT